MGGEDADLAVLGVVGGAEVPALRARRGGAVLGEAGVVEDEYPAVLAELVGNLCLQVVVDDVGIPGCPVQ
ncbi:hypothetical protein ACIHCV_41035 [Streptomyces sp. NPDC051956]|uniref:hypothetical protein n=1 Tax=Streptomyces sp. NPDC051956 TaxID=3365677 RepID=UPI0037D7C157